MAFYYTNELRNDGFGAQYQTIIFAILYAEEFKKGIFLYTKPNLSHIYENEAEYIQSIMNIEHKFELVENSNNKHIEIIDIKKSYDTIEPNLNIYLKSKTMEKIRECFNFNKNCKLYDNNFINVAIHIKRPSLHKNIDIPEHYGNVDIKKIDIKELPNLTIRHTNDQYYINIIDMIKKNNNNKPYKFHLFSEGSIEQFDLFNKLDDIQFHLNEDLLNTYIYMIYADILVTSKSSFSYTAAILSKNNIIYQPFWHKPSIDWFIV
jgi:hypothetical protein